MFRRALILTKGRDDVTIEHVLSHPVGPIPNSLFQDDDTVGKSCKSDLAKQLESESLVHFPYPSLNHHFQLTSEMVWHWFNVLILRKVKHSVTLQLTIKTYVLMNFYNAHMYSSRCF